MRVRCALGVMLLAITTACGGSGNPGDPSSGGGTGGGSTTLANGSMSATIDGVAWAATRLDNAYTPPAGGLPGILQISGSDATGRGVALTASPTGTGTYGFANSLGMNFVLSFTLTQIYQSSALHSGTTAQLILNGLTAQLANGTFTFTALGTIGATGTKSVTNGKFDVKF